MSFQIHAQLFRSFRDPQLISNSPLKSFIWWFLFLSHLKFKFKKHSNRLYSGQCDISSILFKKNKLYGSFQVPLPKVYRATTRRQFTFYHSVPRNSWYPFDQPRKDERLTQPWSHTVALNTVPLGWESSTLTNRPVYVLSLLIFNESEICHMRKANIVNYQEHY